MSGTGPDNNIKLRYFDISARLSAIDRAKLYYQSVVTKDNLLQTPFDSVPSSSERAKELYALIHNAPDDEAALVSELDVIEGKFCSDINQIYAHCVSKVFESTKGVLDTSYKAKVLSRGPNDPLVASAPSFQEISDRINTQRREISSMRHSDIIRFESMSSDISDLEEKIKEIIRIKVTMLRHIDDVDKRELERSRLSVAKIAILTTVIVSFIAIVVGAYFRG